MSKPLYDVYFQLADTCILPESLEESYDCRSKITRMRFYYTSQ